MNNKTKGSTIIVLALLIFFSDHEYAWIMSAALLGLGSGIFLWKK
jgi:hypothetical protein